MNRIKVRNIHLHLTDEPRGNYLINRCLTCDVRANGFYMKGWRKGAWLDISYKTTRKFSKIEMYLGNNAFEIDIILHKKSRTNIFTYKIQSEGLNFYYQPLLNRNEISAGYNRPENVVGSYAVYYKAKKYNSIGSNYGTGKFCHIYRPKAIDAVNNSVWCDLYIDADTNEMSITVPQDFLDNSAYPVRVDPIFGYNNFGASSAPQSNISPEMFLNQHDTDGLTGVTGTITSLFWYGYATDSNVIDVQMGIYDKDQGTLADSTLAETSNTTQISGSVAQWHEHTVNLSVTPSKTHILGVTSEFISGIPPWAVSVYYDTVGYNSRAVYSLGSPMVFPDPLGVATPVSLRVWSFYGQYEPITEATTIQSDAHIVDSSLFVYDTTLTFVESAEVTRDAFDLRLKHICDHNLSVGQLTLATCTRCLGTGFYYDVKFNEIGRPFIVSLEDKLQQALEKIVLTEENKFHANIAVGLKKWLGNAPLIKIMGIIKYDLINGIATLKDNQKSVPGLSPRAQIASIDNIVVTVSNVNSLQYTVTITTVSGETANLVGTVRFLRTDLID